MVEPVGNRRQLLTKLATATLAASAGGFLVSAYRRLREASDRNH
jgi:hypothetical protein